MVHRCIATQAVKTYLESPANKICITKILSYPSLYFSYEVGSYFGKAKEKYQLSHIEYRLSLVPNAMVGGLCCHRLNIQQYLK